MYLSRMQCRTFLTGAILGLVGLSALPSQAENKVVFPSALLAYAKLHRAAPKAAHTIAPGDPMHSVSGLQARIAKLLSPDPHAPKKSKAELEEERREVAAEMREEFMRRHSKNAGKARQEPKEEKEGARSAEWEAARLYQLQQRAFPNDTLDPNALFRASQQRDRLAPANGGIPAKPNAPKANGITVDAILPPNPTPVPIPVTAQWEFVGPRNGISGSFAGRVNALTYDPNNPSIIYLGAAKGGVWKTTDGGTN